VLRGGEAALFGEQAAVGAVEVEGGKHGLRGRVEVLPELSMSV